MLEELKTLIDFHPTSDNQAAVSELLDYVASRLRTKGFLVDRTTHNGIERLYASTHGQKHSRVMLQGHVDVVPGGEDFRTDGDRIYGRGAYDMLFAITSYLAYIDQLEDPTQYDLSILLTGDEELAGENGVLEMLNTQGYTTDICIIPDGGDELGSLNIAAKGLNHFQLRVAGKPHHGSRPWEGDGAGNKSVSLLSEVLSLFDLSDPNNSTLTISQIKTGGTALNQGPSEAFIGLDIRYKDEVDAERLRAALIEIFNRYDASILHEKRGTSATLNMEAPIVKQFIEIYSRHMGHAIRPMKSHGSGDARFFADKNIPVIAFRPDGGDAHGDEEWLSYSSWRKFHDILTDYIDTLIKQ